MKIPFFKASFVFFIASIVVFILWVNLVDLFHDPLGLEESYPYMISFYSLLLISVISGSVGLFKKLSNKNARN